MKTQTGECRLCRKTRILHNSHFMPRSLYKLLRDSARKNPNPIFMNKAKTGTTSKQVTDYVFCTECEDRFGKRESYMTSLLGHGSRFPLENRMKIALPFKTHAKSAEYLADSLGVEADKIACFALSLLWRAAIHQWDDPFGGKSQEIDLGEAKEPIRDYILDKGAFPVNVAVIVHVCADKLSREAIVFPCLGSDSETIFEVLTAGIHFFVPIGASINPDRRAMCCMKSVMRSIFLRNCQDRLVQHYGDIEKTSQRTKAVKVEWP